MNLPTRPFASLDRYLLCLWRCDGGSDLIEYALLTAFIGVTSIGAWLAIEATLQDAYTNRDAGTQDIWRTPDPLPASPPPATP